MPFQIECAFAPGGEFELEGGVVQGLAGSTVFLAQGRGRYRLGEGVTGQVITIDGGSHQH